MMEYTSVLLLCFFTQIQVVDSLQFTRQVFSITDTIPLNIDFSKTV